VHSKSRIPFLLGGLAATAAVTASLATAATTKRFDSTVTLAKKHPFHGHVSSRKDACERHRKVKVFSVQPGRDELSCKTRTNRKGKWSIPSTANGDVYAKVKRRERGGADTTLICRSDRSPRRHFDPKPNILIFLTDDQRARGSMIEMPTVRRVFGRGGTEFTNGYETTPQCCPSRSSIFSGQYAHNTGIVVNDGSTFNAKDTWERYLHRNGYFTGLIGKYLNTVPTDDAPYFDFTDIGGNTSEPEQVTMARAVNEFFRQAEVHDSQPWALEVGSRSPHFPWDSQPDDPRPVPVFKAPFKPASFQEADRTDKHPSVQKRSYSDQTFVDQYHGQQLETQTADEEFSQVWETIKDHREGGGKLLGFFLSDNGYAWGDHGLWGKGEPYLEHSEVPFYVRWPGHVAASAKDARIAANIDIAPTIYDAAGIKPGYSVDGMSLLRDRQRPWLLLEYLNPDTPAIPRWRAFLAPGKREYIQWEDGFVEDYDLRRDPNQMDARNLADPTIAAKIEAAKNCRGADCP